MSDTATTVTAAEFTRLVRASHLAAQQHEPSLAAAYQRGIHRCVVIAKQNFARHTKPAAAHALVAASVPEWALPDEDEVLSMLVASLEVEKATRRPRAKLVEAVIKDTAVALSLDFATTNRLIEGVLEQLGTKITEIADTTRREIMRSLQHSYDEGLSIPHASREMMQTVDALSVARSTMIARTELIGAVNGGSLELARVTGAAQTKTWLATDDDRTRPDHEDADGQTVSLDAPFIVGGAEMMFPGDPDGPAEEVISCRCTLTYGDGEASDDGGDAGMTASAKANRPMRLTHEDGRTAEVPATVEMRGAVRFVTIDAAVSGTPGEATRWHALLAPIDAATDDGRILAPAEDGAISWRELPLTMMAQFETAMGHDGAVVAGRIDQISVATEDGVLGFYADGVFDDAEGGSEAGSEAARLTRDGTLRGISIDLAVEEVELRTKENEPIPEDDEEAFWDALMGDGLMAVTRGTIMGATMTPFPAFADARVVVVASIDHAFAIVAAANAARSVAAAATLEARPDVGEQAASPAAAPILAALPRRDAPAGPPTLAPMLVAAAPIVVSHDEALALGALAAGGFVSRNEVRDRLSLARVEGLDSLAVRADELQAAAIVAAATAQQRDGDAAATLRAVAEGLAASGRTGAAIEQALADVRGAQSVLTSAVERAEQAATRPPRKLRVLRDEQGQATGYEEVQSEKDEV